MAADKTLLEQLELFQDKSVIGMPKLSDYHMLASIAISQRRLAEAAEHQAVSMKRIADVLEALQFTPCNDYGETALPALARAIKDGLRS